MPSTKVPGTTLIVANGPAPAVNSGAGAAAGLVAHLTDPIDAHDASAVSYDGGPTWADGTTNPAGEVDGQFDKIISDLADTTATSGGDKVGVEASTVGTIVLPLGTLQSRLVSLQSAANLNYAGGGAWADGVPNAATNVEAQLDKFISDLTGATGSQKIQHDATGFTWADATSLGGSANVRDALNTGVLTALADTASGSTGSHKLGAGAVTVGTVTNAAGTLYSRLTALQEAANISAGGGVAFSAWLGGRANSDIDVRGALDRIITDLGATTVGDDGAERSGAEARTGNQFNLSVGSVASQLQGIIDTTTFNGANTWTAVQTHQAGLTFNTVEPFPIASTGVDVEWKFKASLDFIHNASSDVALAISQSELATSAGAIVLANDGGGTRRIYLQTPSGTGVTDGQQFRIAGEPGQTPSGVNNNGGKIVVASGAPTTSGTGTAIAGDISLELGGGLGSDGVEEPLGTIHHRVIPIASGSGTAGVVATIPVVGSAGGVMAHIEGRLLLSASAGPVNYIVKNGAHVTAYSSPVAVDVFSDIADGGGTTGATLTYAANGWDVDVSVNHGTAVSAGTLFLTWYEASH